MGTRKCCIKDCSSQEGVEKDAGVTFHRFPHNPAHSEKWLEACKLDSGFRPGKNTYVCSRHFKRENFTSQSTGKFILKCLTVPSIFPWNKSSIVVNKIVTTVPAPLPKPASKPPSPTPAVKTEVKDEIKEEKEDSVVVEVKTKNATPVTRKSAPIKKRTPFKVVLGKSPPKKKAQKRQSIKVEDDLEDLPPPPPAKKKNQLVTFLPGSTIEAQNFDGKWMQVKIIEVDMDDREVLVRSCDKNKNKVGINDEWISMDSPRLRAAQPMLTYEVGEKVLARWNDCRKFPATVKRVLENDTYDVLFDDGYPKIVRGVHINKYSAKNAPKPSDSDQPASPIIINPLLLNPPSLIPDYVRDMKDLPVPPVEGEWCCTWVDDIPIGQESAFDGPHGKLPSILVHDWRVKEGWQKHIYLRQNGKWDVLFISPTNRKLRFKNELKIYLAEIGEVYDPEVWDFSMHKKRSKMLGLCVVSEQFKNRGLVQNIEVKIETGEQGNPFASLGALPYVQPNLVYTPSTTTEVRVGALKVKVIDQMYQCPSEGCDKSFRKENHLQLHIKHYHSELSSLMGECLNMEDLAYLRTKVDEPEEITPVKQPKKPAAVKSAPRVKNENNDWFKDVVPKAEIKSPASTIRSPILEEALKAPIIAGMLQSPTKERESVLRAEHGDNFSNLFDPEHIIPQMTVIKGSGSPNLKRLRPKLSSKQKKALSKKRRFEESLLAQSSESSSVQGIIPYHEGPYFKPQQTEYLDDQGEVIKIVRMKKEEVINCSCGYGEEDGLMIQCELCLCWQHGGCHGIHRSNQVPEKYVCYICRNPYRQRSSQKYFHDQDWLLEGKLPIANYHMPNRKQVARFDSLKQCHTLLGNLFEMKRFMNSLDVKINIAEKQDHPKLYLWAKKWEQSPPRTLAGDGEDVKQDVTSGIDEDVKMLPIIPEPEVAIEPAKCQQTLMDHIQHQQQAVKSRLETIDAEISALEEASNTTTNGKTLVDDTKMKQTLFMLVNDLMKMNEIAAIHRN